jgi:hypothetical protein
MNIVSDNKCKCQEWYPNPRFNNLCSECYSVKYPEEWKKFQQEKWCESSFIPQEILDKFITDNKVIFPGCQWSMLLSCIKEQKDFGSLITMLNYIKRTSKNFLGITANQGAELYKIFKDVHSVKYKGCVGGGSDWRWQHLFAGMIFDKWNINTNTHGPIAICYYGNFGEKPRGIITRDNWISPWMSSSQKKKELWLKSLPEGFADSIK